MTKKLETMLHQVTLETFESLAFMLPVPSEDVDEVPTGESIIASVEFAGPFKGAIRLDVGQGILAPLAENMLGLDEEHELTAVEQFDALKELLNVVCGNLLPRIAGPEAVFDVHAPQLLENGCLTGTFADTPPVVSTEICLDEGRALADLYLSDDAKLLDEYAE